MSKASTIDPEVIGWIDGAIIPMLVDAYLTEHGQVAESHPVVVDCARPFARDIDGGR